MPSRLAGKYGLFEPRIEVYVIDLRGPLICDVCLYPSRSLPTMASVGRVVDMTEGDRCSYYTEQEDSFFLKKLVIDSNCCVASRENKRTAASCTLQDAQTRQHGGSNAVTQERGVSDLNVLASAPALGRILVETRSFGKALSRMLLDVDHVYTISVLYSEYFQTHQPLMKHSYA